MGRALFYYAQAGLALLCLNFEAFAYTPTISPTGAAVRWNGNPRLELAGNPKNTNGFDSNAFRAAVVRGLQRWQAASEGSFAFDYWQGTDTSVYEANSDYNGLSSVYFASGQSGGDKGGLSPNVLGLTQVWYNTETGEVLEADIVLNDRDFQFTSVVSDTSGYGTGSTGLTGGRNRVYIDNVLTHELGHALGLSHAGGLQSTMLFMESPEQAFLSCDDISAVRALYPASGGNGSRGSIAGKVTTENGAGVYGAHVLAISRRRGSVIASALTDRSGNYNIAALEPGDYFISVEPFLAGSQVLPAFFSGIDPKVCPNSQTFARSFLTGPDGFRLSSVRVTAQRNTSAPTFSVRCTRGGGAAVASIEGASSSRERLIFNAATDGTGFGIVDRFDTGSTTYLLSGISGRIELHALSYTLYSPVRPLLALYDEFGNSVEADVADRVYVGESGFTNYDAAIVAENLPRGDYYLEVSGRSLNASLYPAGPVMLDAVAFLVITGSVNESVPPQAASLPFNARCRMSEAFPAYRSPSGNPPRRSTDTGSGGVGFCGSIRSDGGGGFSGPGSGPGGPSAGAIAGWLAPWMFMLLIAQLMKLARLRMHG